MPPRIVKNRAGAKNEAMPAHTDSLPAVRVQRDGAIALVTLHNPPVNALSTAVRQGLQQAFAELSHDADVHAIVIAGSGANFIAGADIREFGQPPQAPSLPEVCNQIEASDKLVIAAIQGAALGGGLEIALSAHYRVAVDTAKVGLPEVALGLLPGAGGTTRKKPVPVLPRPISSSVASRTASTFRCRRMAMPASG